MSTQPDSNQTQDAELELLDLVDAVAFSGEDKPTEELDPETSTKDSQEDLNVDNNTSTQEEPKPEVKEEAEEDLPLVALLKQRLGYEGEDEFEDSEEGVAELVRKSAEVMAKNYLDNELNPTVKEFAKYVELGGDPSTFLQTKFPQTDYTKIEFDEDNDQLNEELVRAHLVATGYEGEDLEAELADVKNGGILSSKAKRALNFLQKNQSQEQEQLLVQQEQKAQQESQEIKQYWDDVRNTITKANAFKGINIAETDKIKFFDYMTKPIKDGKSQRELDIEKATLEDTLAIDYLLYKGFDLSGLITRKAKDTIAKSLRDKLTNSKLSTQKQGKSDNIAELASL